MSDTQNSPETPEPSPAQGVDGPLEIDVTSDTVSVRRAPRFGAFIALGAVVGAVVALILTFTFSGQPTVEGELIEFDRGQVFGFLLLVCGTIGAALGAVVALIVDRASAKRARSVTVQHESAHRLEE
ncbi:potassium transporter Trk [Agromyces sp. NPDC058484]|uniref:potassium transporter Trk n=1 Tax=Agromyces sp. NPDC058484 TaxID=3346524 RepID=UPI00364C673B